MYQYFSLSCHLRLRFLPDFVAVGTCCFLLARGGGGEPHVDSRFLCVRVIICPFWCSWYIRQQLNYGSLSTLDGRAESTR